MSDSINNPMEYFRLKSSETGSRVSSGNMTRAIDSLARFVGGADLSFDSLDIDLLSEWVAHQFFEGYYAKTVAYNLSKIAALYNKAVDERIAHPTDAFSKILVKINEVSDRFDGINHTETFQRLQSICRADYSANPNAQLARDLILFGILNGGMTLEQIANYRKTDYEGDDVIIAGIVEKYSRPKNKYLFPLDQSHSTPRQLLASLETLVGSLLRSYRIDFNRDLNSILVDLWCDIAMNCGATSSEIAACISHTGVSNALTFCAVPAEDACERIQAIRSRVVKALTDNPLHWYAMHLRPHVDFDDLTGRLKEKNITLDEIFYPMEEIFHKVGKKKIFEHRPVISWLVFYRSRITQLNKLFHEIGDIAWGYRYRRDVTSPYAVISDSEIREYQHAIGSLSPSTKIMADEDVEFNPGDYLVILGGPMNGRHGIFIAEKEVKGEASGRVVFRIRLAGGNNINWEVNWDPRLVKKITEEQYNKIDARFQEELNN